MTPTLKVSLLGSFSIHINGKPVTDIYLPRLQSLFAYLLLHREAPQSRAHLAFLFWPETTETQARTNLRNLLHNLRHSLPDADRYLDIGPQTLQWKAEVPLDLDVTNFQTALTCTEQARRVHDSVVVRSSLEQAIALYKGDLMPSCYDDWIIPLREVLCQAYLRALEELVHIFEEERNYTAAIYNARCILRHDPLHESMYRSLIRLFALSGDRASALRAYHTCATVLRRELEVEPSAATREAYERILGTEAQISPIVSMATAYSPLVGREKEWSQMLQDWRAIAAGGTPHAVILSGEAGIGKTRLLEELLQWASRQGISSANTRGYSAEGDLAYAPVTTWLRSHPLVPMDDVWLVEIARLLPEIFTSRPDLPRPIPLTEAWQRQHLFEALSRAILGNQQPLLLAIDDMQWCDRDTLEWLRFLFRFDPAAHFLVIGAYRPEEIGEGHHLLSLLHALHMGGQVTVIDLQPLNEHATKTLATLVAGEEISSENARVLYRETEGNPLFVVETVRARLPITTKPPRKTTDHSATIKIDLPPKVQSVLEARLAQLSPPTRELAGLAATIGREFSFKLLAKSSGCSEDTFVRLLDELWQKRIVREHGVDAYDFSHDKLREAAYSSMNTAHRQHVHRHVAQALEELHSADLNSVCHQVALHYEHAGLPELAIPYYLQAAEVAHKFYSNDEAIALLQHGLSLAGGDEQTHDDAVRLAVAHLWEELGDILEIKARHEDALDAYQYAKIYIPVKDQITQARLYRKEGAVIREQRLYTKALDACHQAEIILGNPPAEEDILWWDEWLEVQVERVWARYWLAQWLELEELVNKVRPVIQKRGNPASQVRFLWASCLMHLRKERYRVSEQMLADAREGLTLSQGGGSTKSRLEFAFELGFLHLWRHELDKAEEHLQASLKLAETAGILQIQTLSLTYLTVLYRFRRQTEVVMDYAQRAQRLAEAAQMPDYVATAKANQAWLAWRHQDLAASEHCGLQALDMWHQSPLVYPFQWLALWPLIGVAHKCAHWEKIKSYLHALLDPTQQLLPDPLNNHLENSIQSINNNQYNLELNHLIPALQIAQEMGYL